VWIVGSGYADLRRTLDYTWFVVCMYRRVHSDFCSARVFYGVLLILFRGRVVRRPIFDRVVRVSGNLSGCQLQ
jgi:hypothetical protein